ncbi:glycine cleavage system aminomethyltransferase GcvT [Spelaeicoccus albus]|uniref:Aminomethyltransferase n=1 Tax=Spelaeicoccus albus TaxID=1280376 RepID=A0A7Z0ACN1_9MICO|nr:glycine cleavage system aminomethyltransferase GcvT [Spelaeicoccus albus]NYI67333.1 aminomethyltransferase [Spelaeicoccus albus]
MSKHTPLHAEHEKLGASFTDFGGWEMPLKYDSELAEHRAVRTAAGVFDLSHMGEVRVSGPAAAEYLDYALAGKMSAMKVGRAKYSFVLTPGGGIVDDLITYRLADDEFLIVPNASNVDAVTAALTERAANFDVQVVNESEDTALVAIQGPEAEKILLRLTNDTDADAVTGLRYYAGIRLQVAGHDALLARTGYTGEDGFEIYVPNADAGDLWRKALEAGADVGAAPAGLASRDSLRLEAGMPLYGHELTVDLTPFAAGLGKVVSMAKPSDFVGRSALEKLKDDVPARVLVGLKSAGRRAGRAGYAVQSATDGNRIGEVTSGAPSPTLGYPIALAYVDVAHSEPGTAVNVDLRGKPQPFEVTALPFYSRKKD